MLGDERLRVKGTEARVCADIAMRQQVGIEKYDTTVEDNPLKLREWVQHAYEEALDLAIYLKRTIEEIDNELRTTAPTGISTETDRVPADD